MINGPLIPHDEMMGLPATETSDASRLVKEPVVSVLVITYNHESFIAQCLDGILMQRTTFPVEVIVGEDRSRDRTLAILTDYQQRHPDRIRLVTSETNLGFNANFLRILARARGRYLATCEGDDYWTDPDKLARQVAVMERFPETTLCGGRTRELDLDGNDLGEWLPARRPFSMQPSYTMNDLMLTYRPHTSSFLLRRSGLQLADCARTTFGLDLLLVTSSALLGEVRCLPDFVSVYRIHTGGAYSGASRLKKARLAVDWHQSILELVGASHEPLWRQLLREHRFGLCDELTEAGEFGEASALARELLGNLSRAEWKPRLHCLLIAYAPKAYRLLLKAKRRAGAR